MLRPTQPAPTWLASFNPHPHRGTGAATFDKLNTGSIEGFNPHPHRGTGAATHIRSKTYTITFQSSPAPRYGCCQAASITLAQEGAVSILTRTEVRVLPRNLTGPISIWLFQSSPAPRYGCCLKRLVLHQSDIIVSILTRTEVRVLLDLISISILSCLFQSSPAPRYGCCHENNLFAK